MRLGSLITCKLPSEFGGEQQSFHCPRAEPESKIPLCDEPTGTDSETVFDRNFSFYGKKLWKNNCSRYT